MSKQDTRNKNKALKVESSILKALNEKGVSKVAGVIGVHKSQVSRWKESVLPRAAMLIAALGLTVMTANHGALDKRGSLELRKEVVTQVRKAKRPGATERFEQMKIKF